MSDTKFLALVFLFWMLASGSVTAANPENELGNWFIYNGTIKLAERWSVFTETQLRLWDVASNVNEIFVRAAPHYRISKNTYVGVGYMHSRVWPFEGGGGTKENRIYEQFTGFHLWSRSLFEHRFRLEQRWIEEAGATDYRNRFRYRLQMTTPLSRPTLQAHTHFLNFYDELMLNFGNDQGNGFDQNRLYGAYGYKFTEHANLQLGLLWQKRPSEDFLRLQIFYTHNFDL